MSYVFKYNYQGKLTERRLQDNQELPKGYFLTVDEALEHYKEKQKRKEEEYLILKPRAVKTLEEKEQELKNLFVNSNVSLSWGDYDCNGCHELLTLNITLKGEFYHIFSREVNLY